MKTSFSADHVTISLDSFAINVIFLFRSFKTQIVEATVLWFMMTPRQTSLTAMLLNLRKKLIQSLDLFICYESNQRWPLLLRCTFLNWTFFNFFFLIQLLGCDHYIIC